MRSLEKWRYRCPRGHTGWEMARRTFWCSECYRRADDRSGAFERVRDQKTEELLTAGELRARLARHVR